MTYYVWITAITGVYDGKIAATLVKRGYTTRALADTLTVSRDDIVGAVIAFSVKPIEKTTETGEKQVFSLKEVYNDILDILKFHKVKYFSLVVSSASDCTWSVGNVANTQKDATVSEKKSVN